MAYASIDATTSPPRVAFPAPYNAGVDLTERHLPALGAKVAYRDDRVALTYEALRERADRAGNALLALGLRPEERVLLVMLDTVDFPAVFLGAIKAGLVPVPVNTQLTPADYAYLLTDSRARALVVSDALVSLTGQAILSANLPASRVLVADTALGGPIHPYGVLGDHLDAAAPRLAAAPTTADDVAFWLYSSGSTGPAKAALHLHAHLMQTAALYAQGVLGLRAGDVVFSAAKLFFAYGLGNALTFPLAVGATAILMAERPTPAAVVRVMRTHSPTIFCGVPTLYAAMLASETSPPEGASPRLRLSVSAGEALPRHVGERWRARVGTDILDGLGSTELLHIFLSNRPGDIRYGTSGRAVPGYDLALRDDGGGPVGDDEEGALWVRGPTACLAYWNQRARSLATFHGPWTRTGDRYTRDADGYYTYSGRADDMLKVGGIWVSPLEVEAALAAHPAVLEAAVTGHGDTDGLIKPKAFVVLVNPAQAGAGLVAELQAFVKQRLAPFKYPRWIEFATELPRTATGKLQRYRLRGL